MLRISFLSSSEVMGWSNMAACSLDHFGSLMLSRKLDVGDTCYIVWMIASLIVIKILIHVCCLKWTGTWRTGKGNGLRLSLRSRKVRLWVQHGVCYDSESDWGNIFIPEEDGEKERWATVMDLLYPCCHGHHDCD